MFGYLLVCMYPHYKVVSHGFRLKYLMMKYRVFCGYYQADLSKGVGMTEVYHVIATIAPDSDRHCTILIKRLATDN